MKRLQRGHVGPLPLNASAPLGPAVQRSLQFVVAFALLLTLIPVARAHAAPPTPSVPLPPEVDIVDNYQGQTLCDPTPKAGALMLRDLLWATYGTGNWAGISRDCNVSWDRGISEHKDGRAIDWGVTVRNGTRAAGDEFVAWATANNGANARRLGIMYLIWDSRMWRLYDMGRGWSEYNQCVSVYTSTSYDTACHRDHVHISMTWHGAGAWTSWYDGTAVVQPGCTAGSPIQVPAGTAQQPAVLFDPLAGVGVAGGRPCYLDESIQTLQVPVFGGGRSTVQRLRVEYTHTNAPSAVKVWSSAGGSVLLSRSDAFPRDFNLPVGTDGRIYVQAPVGQAGIKVLGVGQLLPLRAGQVLEVPVAGGSTGVPSDAKAVALNVTATEARSSGYLRAFPCGATAPGTSNLNFVAGQTVANAVTVGVGAGGKACIQASADTHVVVDLSGFYPAGSEFAPTPPQRLKDTREGSAVPAGGQIEVPVPTGSAAVALSLAVTQPSAAGWVTVQPCGTADTGTSSVNFAAGQTLAGTALVKVGAGDKVCVRASTQTHVVVDLMGLLPGGADFTPLSPVRIADSRLSPGQPLAPGSEFSVDPKVPGAAVAVNLTATDPTAPGWIQAYPCGTAPALTSVLNYAEGQTVANAAIVKAGADGRICVRSVSSTHIVVDFNGTLGPRTFQALNPRRLLDTREP